MNSSRSCSSRLRSVMSCAIAATPTTSPALLRTADMVTAISIRCSVLAPSRDFEAALAQLDHRCDARARIRRLPFRDEDRARLSDHLFGRVAEHLLGALVPARDDAVEVRGRDRVVGRLDDRSELEALELPEAPVRHVEDRAVETNAPVRSGHGLPLLDDVANRPVAVDDAVVRRVRPSALDGGGDVRLQPRAVVGVDDACERPHAVVDEVRRGIADELLDRVAQELHRPVGVDVAAEDGARDVADEPAEPGLALRQREVAVLAGGDVDQESLRQRRLPVAVVDDAGLVLHPDDAAVLRPQPVLSGEGLGVRIADAVLVADALGIVGVDDLPEEAGRCEPFLRGVAEQVLELRADVGGEPRVVERADVADERELLDERAVARVRFAQTGERLLSLGDRLLELVALLLQPPRAGLERACHLAQDREERCVEKEQREHQSDRDGLHRLHRVGIHLVEGRVELEDADRLGGVVRCAPERRRRAP